MAPLTFDLSDVDALVDEWDQECGRFEQGCVRAVEKAVKRGKAEGRARAPARSYELRNSIDAEVQTTQGGAKGEVMGDAPHAALVVTGTRPHKIRPRKKKMLRWRDESGVHFRGEVNHPGTKPNPFWDQTADSVNAELQREVDTEIDKSFRG